MVSDRSFPSPKCVITRHKAAFLRLFKRIVSSRSCQSNAPFANGLCQYSDDIRNFPNRAVKVQHGIGYLPNGAANVQDGIRYLPNRAANVQDGIRYLPNGAANVQDGIRYLPNGAANVQDGIRYLPNGAANVQDSIRDLPNGVLNDLVDLASIRKLPNLDFRCSRDGEFSIPVRRMMENVYRFY